MLLERAWAFFRRRTLSIRCCPRIERGRGELTVTGERAKRASLLEDEKYIRATTKPTHSIRFRTFFARRSKSDEYDFDDPNQNYDNDHDRVISQQTHNNDAIGMVVDMSCMLSSEKFLLNGGKRRKPPPNIELLKELEVQVVRENGTENDRATNNNFVETRR